MMRKFPVIFLCVVLITVGYASAGGTPDITIILNEMSEVSGDWYYLGDIARVSTEKSDVSYALKNIPISTTPLPGSSRTINSGLIQTRLYQAGFNRGEYELKGYDRIRVTTLCQHITASEIMEEINRAIERNFCEEMDIELAYSSVPNDVVMPLGIVSMDVELPSFLPVGRYFTVKLEILANGVPYRALSMIVKINLYGKALVSTGRVSMHDEITINDFQLKRVCLSDSSGTPLPTIQEGEMRATRTIPEGRVLLDEHVEPIPHVVRGDELDIVVQLGNVTARARGTASSNALVGDTISVRNTQSGKTVTGLLIDKKTVKVN